MIQKLTTIVVNILSLSKHNKKKVNFYNIEYQKYQLHHGYVV